MGFFEKAAHHLADDAKAREDHDVDFGVPEKPEEMLEEQGIATTGLVEKNGSEVAVGEKHRDGAGEHRQRQKKQKRRHQDTPDEQRHLVQGHSGRAHVENGGDEIDGAQDRRCTGDVQRENDKINRRPRMPTGGQGWVKRPSRAGTVHACRAFHEH